MNICSTDFLSSLLDLLDLSIYLFIHLHIYGLYIILTIKYIFIQLNISVFISFSGCTIKTYSDFSLLQGIASSMATMSKSIVYLAPLSSKVKSTKKEVPHFGARRA